METKNSYLHLKETIEKHFSFLAEFGYGPLTEENSFLRTKFITNNSNVILSFKSDGYGTLVWLDINETGFKSLEPNNSVLNEIQEKNKHCFDELIMKPFAEKKKIPDDKKQRLMIEIEDFLHRWLNEMAEILKRNSQVL